MTLVGKWSASQDGELRAHTASPPWVCANTDERRGGVGGGGGIWHYNDGFHYTCTFSGCLVRKKKVWMCWARWLWLLETAFKKVAQAAQTFNWVPSPFHGDACPALLLPLALYGASKVLSVWWRVRPAISKSAQLTIQQEKMLQTRWFGLRQAYMHK